MAKHGNKIAYRNASSSPDERQRSLVPGTDEYKKRMALQRLQDAYNLDKQSEPQSEQAVQTEQKLPPIVPDPNRQAEFDVSHNVAVRKFRRRRTKQRQTITLKKEIDAAIDKDVNITNPMNVPGVRSMDEEVYDDGIDEYDFAKDVVRDYEADLAEIMRKDNNHDGEVDDEDITPAMRRMQKHM